MYMFSHLFTIDPSDSPLVQHLLTSWPTWQLSPFDPHTYTCTQALFIFEPGFEAQKFYFLTLHPPPKSFSLACFSHVLKINVLIS